MLKYKFYMVSFSCCDMYGLPDKPHTIDDLEDTIRRNIVHIWLLDKVIIRFQNWVLLKDRHGPQREQRLIRLDIFFIQLYT